MLISHFLTILYQNQWYPSSIHMIQGSRSSHFLVLFSSRASMLFAFSRWKGRENGVVPTSQKLLDTLFTFHSRELIAYEGDLGNVVHGWVLAFPFSYTLWNGEHNFACHSYFQIIRAKICSTYFYFNFFVRQNIIKAAGQCQDKSINCL